MECPECAHADDEAAFETDEGDSWVCPECDFFWSES